jgi:hypothetical protein
MAAHKKDDAKAQAPAPHKAKPSGPDPQQVAARTQDKARALLQQHAGRVPQGAGASPIDMVTHLLQQWPELVKLVLEDIAAFKA